MGTQAKAPVGSRWTFKTDTKARVFVVIERKAFGALDIKQEDRAYFGNSTVSDLLANAVRQPDNAAA